MSEIAHTSEACMSNLHAIHIHTTYTPEWTQAARDACAQKRPVYVCQKRPIYMYQKRPIYMCEKRPIQMRNALSNECVSVKKRPIYVCQKRPIGVRKASPALAPRFTLFFLFFLSIRHTL